MNENVCVATKNGSYCDSKLNNSPVQLLIFLSVRMFSRTYFFPQIMKVKLQYKWNLYINCTKSIYYDKDNL